MTKYELAFRITLAYLILFRCLVVWLFPVGLREVLNAKMYAADRVARKVTTLLAAAPLALYLVAPMSPVNLSGDFPDMLRWLAVVPAVISVMWTMWSLHVASGPDEFTAQSVILERLFQKAPYRFIRHPVELGDSLFFISLAVVSGQVLACLGAVFAGFLTFTVIVPRRHKKLHQLFAGGPIPLEIKRLAWFPRLPKARYQVPRRFGLTAILGVITILCLVFGGLNMLRAAVEVPPAVDLFFAGQFLIICVAQMFFQKSPRAISAIAGAILLPAAFVAGVIMESNRAPVLGVMLGSFCLSLFGLLMGYCVGALAAGFFLIVDRIENYFIRKNSR